MDLNKFNGRVFFGIIKKLEKTDEDAFRISCGQFSDLPIRLNLQKLSSLKIGVNSQVIVFSLEDKLGTTLMNYGNYEEIQTKVLVIDGNSGEILNK